MPFWQKVRMRGSGTVGYLIIDPLTPTLSLREREFSADS
jgi:hypothetical protein